MIEENKYVTPYEFLLKINDNIILQRYFNVRNYNSKSINSLEIIEMMDELMEVSTYQYNIGLIPNFFKKLCVNKLWSSYHPKYIQTNVKVKDNYENEDVFNFEVLVNNKIVAKSSFSANLFQYSVRRSIDIRKIIPEIIKIICYYLSLKEYTHNYGDVELIKNHIK